MTLADLQYLFTDEQQVKIYDVNQDDVPVIYSGDIQDLPEEMEEYEVSSIDSIYDWYGYIGINVLVEE